MNWWVIRRRLHVSWWIMLFALAFVAGVAAVKFISPTSFSSLAWLAVGLIGLVFILWRRAVYLLPLVVLMGGVIGLWRGSIQAIELADLKGLVGQEITLSGQVSEDTDSNSAGELTLRLNRLKREDSNLQGAMWVNVSTAVDIKRGDSVTVSGKASEGFGSFGAAIYRGRLVRVERPEPGDVARQARDWFSEKVETAVPSPESSLGLGYLVGQKRALPIDLIEALQIVGLTHVVVASGYNLTILVRLARRLFEKVSKYLSALSAASMILFFIAVTGLSPSMSRAGLVAGLSLAAWYYGRRFHPLILLTFAAGITVAINPSYVWGDLGWELSFAAFAGVMILAPLLQRYFFGDKKPSGIRQIVGETLSALLVTAPILIFTFGQFSNVALVANILVLPLVPLAMLLTAIAGVGAIIIPGLATIIGLPASWLLQYMIGVAQYLSSLPWATSLIQFPLVGVVISYMILVGLCFYLQHATKFDLHEANIVE